MTNLPLTKTDREFRLPKVGYIDFKQLEMDRVLTAFFQRLKYKRLSQPADPAGNVRIDGCGLPAGDLRASGALCRL